MNWSLPNNIRRLRRKSLVGQIVLLLVGVELLGLASFTCLTVPTPTKHNLERYVNVTAQRALSYAPAAWQEKAFDRFPILRLEMKPVRTSTYVPVTPVAIFIGYVWGLPLGAMCSIAYLLAGMIGPHLGCYIFASGGGFDYVRQPAFGYLLGLVFGSWFAGRITDAAVNSWRQALAIGGGLFLVHALGLLFLVGGCLGLFLFEGEAAYLQWQPWLFESIRNLSWYPLPYDALFSLALVGLGFPFRFLAAMMTAPDIAMRSKTKWDAV